MRYLFSVLLLSFSLPASSQEPAETSPPEPDAHIVSLLDELGYLYETEANGDFRLLFDFDDGRSQLVWIRNRTYEYGGVAMRDIWSTALELSGRYASVKLADALLRGSWDGIMGGWAREGDRIVYIAKVPAAPGVEQLDAAIGEVIEFADKLELEETQRDDF